MLKFLLAPFSLLFKAIGVNQRQLEAILKAKLTMDNRKSNSFSHSNKTSSSQIFMQMLSFGFLGLLFVLFMVSIPSVLLSYTLFFAMMMTMVALAMISEFTTLLFDVRDNHILVSRPINNETLAVAKIFHIAIYLFLMTLSLSFGLVIYTVFKYGIAVTLVLLLMLVLACFFVLFLTNIFYFVLSNLVSTQRLKDIIVYTQVVMVVLFMGAYQLLPRILDHYDIEHISSMALQWWYLLVPAIWTSAALEMFIHQSFDIQHLVFVVFAFVVPTSSLVLVVKVLSPRFNKALQNEDRIQKKTKTLDTSKACINAEKTKSLLERLAYFVTPNQQEKACFLAIWKMSGRERKYKQTTYPVFAYVFIFIAIYVFKNGGGLSLESLKEGTRYLIFLYFPMLLSYSLIANLSFTEYPKSSWFFRTMPISGVGVVMKSALKVVFIKYFMPVFALISIICFYIWGIEVIDDVILALMVNLMIMILMQKEFVRELPFTIEKSALDMGSNFVRGMFLTLGIFLIGGAVYLLNFIDYASMIAIFPILFINIFLFKSYHKISWKGFI